MGSSPFSSVNNCTIRFGKRPSPKNCREVCPNDAEQIIVKASLFAYLSTVTYDPLPKWSLRTCAEGADKCIQVYLSQKCKSF